MRLPKSTVGILAFVLGPTALTGLAVVVWSAHAAKHVKEQPHTVYHMRYGMAACATARKYACGITLTNCTDDRTYECMTDVMYEAPR